MELMNRAEKHIRHYNHMNGKPIRKEKLAAFHATLVKDIEARRIDAHMPCGVECIDIEKRLQRAIKKINGHMMIAKCDVVDIEKIRRTQAVAVERKKKADHTLAGHKKKEKKKVEPDADEFGQDYPKYRGKPKEAILHLMEVKQGQVKGAIYRKGVGRIDFVWGEGDTKKKDGFGLAHIMQGHAEEMDEIGMKPENVIPSVIRHGRFGKAKGKDRILIETDLFAVLINTKFRDKKKVFLLTAFDLRKREIKRQGLNGTVLGIDNPPLSGSKKPLPSLPLSKGKGRKNRASKVKATKVDIKKKEIPAQQHENQKVRKTQKSPNSPKPKGLASLGFTSVDSVPEAPKDMFRLPGALGRLLGDLQPYKLEIVIAGETSSGKSELAKQLANAFATTGREVAFLDWEQGGMQSRDTIESIHRNITAENRKKVHLSSDVPKTIEAIKSLAGKFPVIIVDSGTKLNQVTNAWIDELREEYPETIWVILMQQNTKGGTRGGTAAEFDSPVVIKTYRPDESDHAKNYAYFFKNRGNKTGQYYSISGKKEITDPTKIESK